MSAFQVSKRHIDALVYARTLNKYRGGSRLDDMSETELGRMLWRENMASLASLYGKRHGTQVDKSLLESYQYARPYLPDEDTTLTPIALIKLARCYEYQSCEHEAWKTSKAAEYCRCLVDALVNLVPGYAEAAWGIE